MSMPFILQLNQLNPLKSVQDIERFGLALEALDYQIADVRVIANMLFEQGSLNVDELEFSDSLQDALPDAYQYRNLRFEIRHRHNELELLVSVAWYPTYEPDLATLYASTYQRLFLTEGNSDNPEFDAVYYGRHMLDLGKALYGVTSPKFGWAEHGPLDMGPSVEEVDAFRVFPLEGVYWANFFSPAFVERIGRQRLAHPPIGWSEPLQNGGMLYVIAPTYFGGDFTGRDRERMRQYFGL